MGRFSNDKNAKNFGNGRNMGYAAKAALEDYYQGHYSTVATHYERFVPFIHYCREELEIRDFRLVDKVAIESYAEHIQNRYENGEIQIAYSKNLISSMNKVMEIFREDKKIRVEPRNYLPNRKTIRTESPKSMDRERVYACAEALREAGHERAATVLEVARDTGMRTEEIIKFNFLAAVKHINQSGNSKINISDFTTGMKGGRDADRYVTPYSIESLKRGADLQSGDSKNMIEKSYINTLREIRHPAVREIMREHGLAGERGGFHDARAGFACERYRDWTNTEAPAVSGNMTATRDLDKEARMAIARELGHGENRVDVLGAYVGGRK